MRLLITALACLINVSTFCQCVSGNCLSGFGVMKYEDGSVYEGEWKQGRMSGKGKYIFSSGDVYTGDFRMNSMHGEGVCAFINGDVYEGEWSNDKMEGFGTLKYINGDIYEGKWRKNKMRGHGVYSYSNGDVYEGYFLNDQKHGLGKLICLNGDVKEGEWKHNKLKVDDELWDQTNIDNNKTKGKNENISIRTSDLDVKINKVAVVGKESNLCDGSKDDGQGLAELVEGELLGIYGVVERKHLEEILDEQRLAMSGLLLEDSDFAQAGCLAGAQGTVLVSYGCIQDQTKLQVKLVDCSTSDLYWSATGLDVSAFDLMYALRIELSN